MALEAVLCAHFFFREWNPVVHAVAGHDAVLPMKEREYKAVVLKLHVVLPAIVWEKELVAVVQPIGFNAVAGGNIDRRFYNVGICYP